jgi:hypothetical protein
MATAQWNQTERSACRKEHFHRGSRSLEIDRIMKITKLVDINGEKAISNIRDACVLLTSLLSGISLVVFLSND